MKVHTSESHPIRVDWLPNQGTAGNVGLTLAPGKHSVSQEGHRWARDLTVDLTRLRTVYRANVLVCLLEDDEMVQLRIGNLVEAAHAVGLVVHRLPIPDGGVLPDTRGVERVVADITRAADDGKNVVVHCQGGLGRAGTVGGCWLRSRGLDAVTALRILRQTRGERCPENQAQRDFVTRYV